MDSFIQTWHFKALFCLSKSEAVNADIYINECLQSKLLPFKRKNHGDFNYLFWPELAGAYYSNEIMVWMEENAHFIEKASNLPNVPQARPS